MPSADSNGGASPEGKAALPRSSLSLPEAAALRDRAARVGAKAGSKKGRPRRRFLAEQRDRAARLMLPAFATLAAVIGIVTVVDRVFGSPPPDTAETLLGLTLTGVLAIASLLLPLFNKSLTRVATLGGVTWVVTMLGWGVIAHVTGGATSPYLLCLPLTCLGIAFYVPWPPRVAAAGGLASYVALYVASAHAPLYAHLLVLAVGLAGVVVAKTRLRVAIRRFLRTERYRAAVSRMRRVQEQLVVVEKLEALRVLVGGMAHELNNALAISVASNQQALKAVDAESPAAAALKRSDGGLTRIRRTVDRIRRFAMSAEGVLEPADVGAMLDFALESAIGRARSGVIIERTYDPSVGAIECHVAALAEALFQIARNAVEAMPGGGTIHAGVRNEGDRVVLSVGDEGHGIPAGELARVFDPFYSRGRGTTAKSGLGLSAVYGLVSALGGRVEIESAVGKGTEVAIIMPRRLPKEKTPPVT